MTNYVWYPVTGDGQTPATQYIWNTGTLNWNTTSDWVQGSTLVFENPSTNPGSVPGSGTGSSGGPGVDNVGLVAGEVSSLIKQYYQPNPSKGDPYIGSNVYSVDVLINSGTVDINNLLLSGFNQYNLGDPSQLPVLDVEGATFKVEGSVANSAVVIFPTVTNVPLIGTAGGTLLSSGGGTIDIGSGGTVQIAGSVQPNVVLKFNDANSDVLNLGGVSAGAPGAFAGSIANFAAGDTIFLPELPSPASYTSAYSNGTLAISNGTTTLAELPVVGSFTSSSFSLVSANGGTDVILGSGITPPRPTIATDAGLTVAVGGSGTITSALLLATETGVTPAQLIYTVTSSPSAGTVLKNGAVVTSFTQADVNAGSIVYQESTAAATSDTIAFRVTDPSNDSVSGSFPVTITPASTGGLLNSLTAAQQLELIYIAYFNRAADGGGAGFWGLQNIQAQAGGQSAALALTNIANSFTPQAETIALYPFLGTPNLNLNTPAAQAGLTAFVNSVYGNLFARAADPGGTSYWVGQVTSGAVGLGAAALAIANGATGTDAIELQNKITVAADFTTKTSGAGLGLTAPLPASFLATAASVLKSVDGTSLNDASVTAGMAATANYIATSASGSAQAASAAADPTIITISSPNQVIDPGAGNHTIQFLSGSGADTIVLRADAVDQMSGFDPSTDVLDLRSLLSAANVDLTGAAAALSNYLTVSDTAGNAQINFDPTGHGGGGAIAVLQGLGGTSLNALVDQGAVRFT